MAHAQGDFAMLCFGVTRNFEDAKERLENLAELVRQSGEPHVSRDVYKAPITLRLPACRRPLPGLAIKGHALLADTNSPDVLRRQ